MNDVRPDRSRRGALVAVLAIAVLLVFAVGAYSYASPYLVLDRLKRAADARDAETVNQYVDYPALRTSLKQQVTELLARRLDAQKRTHPFAALGALVGMALIGPLVDAYATPDGVAALLDGMPPHGNPGETPPRAGQALAPNTPSAPPPSSAGSAPPPARPKPPRATAGYRDTATFAVTYRRDAQSAPYSVIFRRSGWFDWRLVAVDLNQQP